MSAWLSVLVYAALGITVLIVFITACRTQKPVRCMLSSMVQGVCAMAAVDVAGIFTGVSLGFGWFTMLCCTAFGAPGVIAMLLMRWVSL